MTESREGGEQGALQGALQGAVQGCYGKGVLSVASHGQGDGYRPDRDRTGLGLSRLRSRSYAVLAQGLALRSCAGSKSRLPAL